MNHEEYRRPLKAAERKATARQKIVELRQLGYQLQPIDALKNSRQIATSFWGRSWCRHLEHFSHDESRLPRGRSYLRQEAVLHLAIEAGEIHAMVLGSELYELSIQIDTLPTEKWTALRRACQGQVASLIELLQGKFADEVMALISDPEQGLFPLAGEIHFNCNCPDWADMCKHVAAVLYGVAARLDQSPELLFTLRGVDQSELISVNEASEQLTQGQRKSNRRRLQQDVIKDVFNLEQD